MESGEMHFALTILTVKYSMNGPRRLRWRAEIAEESPCR
jgi:hypothetical protein